MVYADDGNGTTTATGILKAENVPKMIRKTTEKYIKSQFDSERRLEEGYCRDTSFFCELEDRGEGKQKNAATKSPTVAVARGGLRVTRADLGAGI